MKTFILFLILLLTRAGGNYYLYTYHRRTIKYTYGTVKPKFYLYDIIEYMT